jgi:hypothetical protein
MQLVEQERYCPQKHGFFLHAKSLLAVHPSTRTMAYQTRACELVLRDMVTGRNVILNKSAHPFTSILFTRNSFNLCRPLSSGRAAGESRDLSFFSQSIET